MKDRNIILQKLTTIAFAVILLAGIYIIIEQLLLKEMVSALNICFIESILCLTAYCAWKSNISYLFLPAAIGSVILLFCTCFLGVTPIDKRYLVQAAAAITALISGTAVWLPKRRVLSLRSVPKGAAAAVLLLTAFSLCFWGVNTYLHKQDTAGAGKNIWAVPSVYDHTQEEQAGTLEKIDYQTKAYATDHRTVTKSAYVYLPFGYDSEKSYNILYLMHGTGDDESYWLEKNAYNKLMVDRMTADGIIGPMIIVTPSFYVEDDCAGDLDQLTYSFQDELRNDLMPAVEGTYSTYAESCDTDSFTASRDHRAFAGLSRGAVTTLHSALCGSLDYFSWFGAFSGSRTDGAYLQETIQTDSMKDYPIHCFYITSGSYDFALSGQIADYRSILDTEPRLKEGVNTTFDVFPMRYHSTGAWHLALYNFLPQIFLDSLIN